MSKEFLKPDWRKLILFLILMILTSAIPNFGFGIWWTGADIGRNYGFPFNFYGYGGGPPLSPGEQVPFYFNVSSLVLNILVWYLISCLIIIIYDKVKE